MTGIPCPKCKSPLNVALGSRSRKPTLWICQNCDYRHLLRYEEATYKGKMPCSICDFTAATGHYWEDTLAYVNHWSTHTYEEKRAHSDSFPTPERTSNPLYGWENRLHRLSTDIRRLEDTVLRIYKRPVEERLAFKMKMEELHSRWTWFEDFTDLIKGAE